MQYNQSGHVCDWGIAVSHEYAEDDDYIKLKKVPHPHILRRQSAYAFSNTFPAPQSARPRC